MGVGAPPVDLGGGVVAQIHADRAAADCHASHWDTWGPKPQHRYALAGGDQNVSENIFAYGPCRSFTDHEGVPTLDEDETLRDAVRQLAESPSHRRTMTNPQHTTMHAGVRILEKRAVIVQLFNGQHVIWVTRPSIKDGILRMGGTIENRRHRRSDRILIEIEKHPAPRELSTGQLARTGCVPPDQLGAVILPPPPPGAAYRDPESGEPFQERTKYRTRSSDCRDPYTIPVDVSPPVSWQEAKRLHEETASSYGQGVSQHSATAIIARNLTVSWQGRHFSVTADLRELIAEAGPGIYTAVIHTRQEDEQAAVPMARYPMFVGAAPPLEHPYGSYHHQEPAQSGASSPKTTQYPTGSTGNPPERTSDPDSAGITQRKSATPRRRPKAGSSGGATRVPGTRPGPKEENENGIGKLGRKLRTHHRPRGPGYWMQAVCGCQVHGVVYHDPAKLGSCGQGPGGHRHLPLLRDAAELHPAKANHPAQSRKGPASTPLKPPSPPTDAVRHQARETEPQILSPPDLQTCNSPDLHTHSSADLHTCISAAPQNRDPNYR